MYENERSPKWDSFLAAIKQEVKPALGCTEPISLALAAATAASHLGGAVERIDAWVSPNLMKNGMGVTVPGTGMVGLPVAAALGALGGDAQAGLEVLKRSTAHHLAEAKKMLEKGLVKVKLQSPCEDILYARAKLSAGDRWCSVTIVGDHTRIVSIETQDGILFSLSEHDRDTPLQNPLEGLRNATLSEVYNFSVQVPFEAIRFILEAGRMNNALSEEGLQKTWGLHIGATLNKQRLCGLLADDLSTAIVIRTSAASDARMGGASLPAMTNSGSGNQGIAATLPVLVVAEHFSADDEQLARALILSHLCAIYIHNQLPRLSALCAATTAAMGAAAGMAWLAGGDYHVVSMAIASMIGDVSGIICDGASNSCAMKVSTSVSSAWKAVLMALDGSSVSGHEGIVDHDVEHSIANLCSLACNAMQHTDQQIIRIMSHKALA